MTYVLFTLNLPDTYPPFNNKVLLSIVVVTHLINLNSAPVWLF